MSLWEIDLNVKLANFVRYGQNQTIPLKLITY